MVGCLLVVFVGLHLNGTPRNLFVYGGFVLFFLEWWFAGTVDILQRIGLVFHQ